MKISDLLKSECRETFDFRGHTAFVVVTPDVYMLDDTDKLNRSDMKSIAEFVAKGLKRAGTVVDGQDVDFTDDSKKQLKMTADSIRANIPESFLMQTITKIEMLKMSTAGKPTSPKN
jgi:hypothetical protein